MSSPQQQLETLKERHQQAQALQNDGKPEAALEVYRAILETDDRDLPALHQMAQICESRGEFDKAIAAYQKAIEVDENPPFWVYRHLGFSLSQKGELDGAIEAYEQAIALNSEEVITYGLLGQAQGKKGDIDLAISSYEKQIELNSDVPIWVYLNLGEGLNLRDRIEEAIAAYEKALALEPENTGIQRLLEVTRVKREARELDPQVECLQQERPLDESLGKDESDPVALHQTKVQSLPEDIVRLDETSIEAIYITNQTLLLRISSTLEIQPDIQIEWEAGQPCQLSFWEKVKTDTAQEYLLAISSHQLEKQEVLRNLIISSSDGSPKEKILVDELNPYSSDLLTQFLEPLSTHWSQEKLFCFLVKLGANFTSPPRSPILQLWRQLREGLGNSSKIKLEYGCWLSPSLVYLEASIEDRWVFGEHQVLLFSDRNGAVARGYFFQISHNQLAGVTIANQDIYTSPYEFYTLTIVDREEAIPVEGGIFEKSYSLEFIHFLDRKPEYQKHLIRERLSWGVINMTPKNLQHEVGNLLYKLQSFVHIPPRALVDPNLPFNIFIDRAIPIHCDGLFLHGWMHDPYDRLEGIEVISALGFSMFVSQAEIYRIERQDVNEYIQTTRYSDFESKLGFFSYVRVPQEIRQKFQDFAQLHSFRFKIKLSGGIELEIIPDTKYHDVFAARQIVVKIAPTDRVSDDMLEHCIGPAASALQKLCIDQVKAKEVKTIGKPVRDPIVSIIIPLYKQLDFMKVQLATLAHDPYTESCQIIYVLDSPEQEQEVKNFLIEHCALYQIPIELVVMNRNSGYAAANNTGAQYARGQYLVLMNSDVFPKTQGWAEKMVAFYETSPQIGAIAPKLIYEDESLQHAGMFFDKTTFPFWITLHYYKGFSNHYSAAKVSRPVPAVTGACLMIRKDLYEKVGGYSTDYVIGDFEDSDLCLKCADLGYESWYFAEAELYHLERQSVPQSPVYSGSVVWRYNANIHQQRWGSKIENTMQFFQNY